jgi:hypothetical protein
VNHAAIVGRFEMANTITIDSKLERAFMKALRRHLGASSVALLFCQVGSLAALGPFEWNAQLRAVQAPAECLQAGPGEQCPMTAADGQPCPMHQVAASQVAASKDNTCSMRAAYSDPIATMLSLFAAPVVPIHRTHALLDHHTEAVFVSTRGFSAVSLALDAPPPRS